MSIDELGRAAASATRAATAELDPVPLLASLRRRRRRQRVASSALAVVVVGVLAVGALEVVRHPSSGPPAHRPTPAPTLTPPAAGRCDNVAVICLDHRRLRITVTAPITVVAPQHFANVSWINDKTIEAYRTDVDNTGVTVIEGAVPVRNDASWARDPAAGDTAKSVAQWLSTRPFLTDVKLSPIALDGRAAWRVSGRLRASSPLPAAKLGMGQVAPTFSDGSRGTLGYNRALRGEYTLLDVPGVGLTVVWSWTVGQPRTVLAGNRPFVAALHW